ncbi:MAG TPA: hypothetical protein VIL35_06160 [Vicinamibacterales bacterium]
MISEYPVIFHSQGVPLAGRILRRGGLAERQPGIVVMGSWLTVKEQMATVYARQMAERGYTALTFDFAGFGESAGEPRQTEIPSRKIADIGAAVDFLRSLSFVAGDRLALLAICASAQYSLAAIANGLPVRSFASVAGWYHDPASVAPFYGGEDGVQRRLSRAREAFEAWTRTRQIVTAPAYEDGNDRAGMHFRLDYYGRVDRGAVPEWKNEMAEMTWFYWLTFDGLAAADRVTTPSIFVHSDGCAFPDHVRQVHARVQGPKELVWLSGSQIDFYDQPEQVNASVEAVSRWFDRTVNA